MLSIPRRGCVIRHRRAASHIAAVFLLCSHAAAYAADPPPAVPAERPGITADNVMKSAEDLARSAGDVAKSVGTALGGFIGGVAEKMAPAGPASHLPAQISDEDRQFFAILEAVGLELKDVTVSKGVVPSANYRFVAIRDPGDADVAKAEELLRGYRDSADGLRARAKQRIARSTLDTVATHGFLLTAMDVSLSPWPDASYQITARSPTPGTEAGKP